MNLIKSNSRRSGEMNAPELPARLVLLLTNAPHAHLVARSELDRVSMLPNVVSVGGVPHPVLRIARTITK